jgi:DsbC/DsbD-like thiol-disulfide interchange protein
MAALHIALKPGWHTYWRSPGAAGIPARFEWDGSSALDDVAFQWPIPTVYEQNGMRFIGYEDELILPITFTPPASGGDIKIKGRIAMGVCKDVCLPVELDFSGMLPETATTPVPLIQASLTNQPIALPAARCTAEPIADGMKITATLSVPDLGDMEMAVLEHPNPEVWVSDSVTSRNGNTLTLTSELVPANAVPFFIDRSALSLTVIGNGTAYEAKGCTGG